VARETLLTSSADLIPALETVRDSGVRRCLADHGMEHSLCGIEAPGPPPDHWILAP